MKCALPTASCFSKQRREHAKHNRAAACSQHLPVLRGRLRRGRERRRWSHADWRPASPGQFRRLCSKGAALADTLDHAGRLLHPLVYGQRASWESALDRVASGFSKIIAEHGPDAVAFYVSGQLLTEDYYVANKLMKGFIGSANIDTNSRLCMSTAVAAHKRAFGADAVPVCYEDIEAADLVVIVGSNLAWAHPVLYQRLAAAKQARPSMQVVVVDPRRTATCDIADSASDDLARFRCLSVQWPVAPFAPRRRARSAVCGSACGGFCCCI